MTIGGRDFGSSTEVEVPTEVDKQAGQDAAAAQINLEKALAENFENERDKVIKELMGEMSYRQQLYSLASEYSSGLQLWFVLPIVILGTLSAFGAFLNGTPLVSDSARSVVMILLETCVASAYKISRFSTRPCG